ncbi:MAG: exodeoxyribonuclease V subunit beta [Mariprofundus sp.]|nr:exodeoxyribonuclease V subunit beta [Mariprofundus sp.]
MSSPVILDAATTLTMDLQGIKLVEASAGTGKTYAIGNLYLRMVLAGFKVGQILVVTYTKAATEELRGRIRLRLHQALLHLQQPEVEIEDEFLNLWLASLSGAQKLEIALQLKLAVNSMDEAAIYTIHGFCQRTLTENAFNSRQPFDVEMITDDSALWDQALKDWWRKHAYRLQGGDLSLFATLFKDVNVLMQLQQPMRRPRVQLLASGHEVLTTVASESDVNELFLQYRDLENDFVGLKELWQQHQSVVERALQSDAIKKARKVYKADSLPTVMRVLNHYFDSDELLQFPPELEAIRSSVLISQLKKNKQEVLFEHPLFCAIDRVIEQYLKQSPLLKQQIKLRVLYEAHQAAAAQVSELKTEAGLLSFDDQLVMLEKALAANEVLAEAIQRRFPMAMIDEFQDTDATQYDIFSHIYRPNSGVIAPTDEGGETLPNGLIMIGDPKQAIYGFRGGDIFTYMRAKHHAQETFTLDTNYRSTPRLIKAVNQLFSSRAESFIYDKEIPFVPVKAAIDGGKALVRDGLEVTPLTLWQLPKDGDKEPLSQKELESLLHGQTANEIVSLLQQGRAGTLLLADIPVQPGDIAVLVRTHSEASGLQQALTARGVASVTGGSQSVFESEEAVGLSLLLAAVIDYRDGSLLKQAMGSSLLAYHYLDIYQKEQSETKWLQWGALFQKLNERWLRQGFMAMFQQLLRRLDIGGCLAATTQVERRLTNLLHLGELLQQQSRSLSGMDLLLRWLNGEIHKTESGEAEMRLESDSDLVRIVTIHGSKGLEYPIVFLPYLWNCRPRVKGKGLLPFYDPQTEQHYLLDAVHEADLYLPEKERLAEDVRLAYVALTRGCSKIYLAWGLAGNSAAKSAIGWLLHPVQQADDLHHSLPDLSAFSIDLDQTLDALVVASRGDIERLELSADIEDSVCLEVQRSLNERCKIESFKGSIANDWRISSFTSLTRDVHQSYRGGSDEVSDDAVFLFPAGKRTGLFLHALLEKLDFQGDVRRTVNDFSRREAVRYGLKPEMSDVIEAWMQALLHTPLGSQTDPMQGFTLAQINSRQRLNELSFDFSLSYLPVRQLNKLLAVSAGCCLQALNVDDCRGLINGVIDLVFEHDGLFYLVDYKSNHLGFSLENYGPEQLEKVMYDRRYDLQYLLYTLALHRYLKLRMADYDYDRHIGGVYYLFLRGMRKMTGARSGVYFTKPARALIEQLDALFQSEERS